ncbi:unnamed protein product [Diamesa tonsa]
MVVVVIFSLEFSVAYGFPDLRSCLLNQKLQMLNICMERRNLREGGLPFSMQDLSLTPPNAKQQLLDKCSTSKTDSDEEFFDCDDDKVDDETSSKNSPWSPVGRLSKLGKMLLIDSDEELYIPVTQDPVPKTEDELEDDAEMLLKLGSDSEFRTQLMSATLLSDMESFKAANPTAKIDDFIRWYSPRDWIEEDSDERDPFGRIGHLSDRMMIPGNTWQTVWKSAKPVPARRQKRLFDDTKEAEKVLHFFESQTLGQICQLTVAPLFHTAILRIQKESDQFKDLIPNFKEIEEKLRQTCCTLARDKWNSTHLLSKKKWEIVINEIANFELKINQVLSIIKKLYPDKAELSEDDNKLLLPLMKCYDTELDEGAKNEVGVRVMYMFNLVKATQSEQRVEDQQWSLPDPIEKQFALRLSGNTVTQGVGGPQLMRVILQPTNFRVCGAFSRNTTFAYPS